MAERRGTVEPLPDQQGLQDARRLQRELCPVYSLLTHVAFLGFLKPGRSGDRDYILTTDHPLHWHPNCYWPGAGSGGQP